MEELTKIKIEQFHNIIIGFEKSLGIILEKFNELEQDVIKNGQIQKFEYCVENMWKTLKVYLSDIYGLDIASPKSVVKEFFEKGHLSYDEYESLIDAINDRNLLSHVYNEEKFEKIYMKLKSHMDVLLVVYSRLK